MCKHKKSLYLYFTFLSNLYPPRLLWTTSDADSLRVFEAPSEDRLRGFEVPFGNHLRDSEFPLDSTASSKYDVPPGYFCGGKSGGVPEVWSLGSEKVVLIQNGRTI